jgi:hypothetical protein
MVGAEGGRLNRYPALAGHRRDRLIEHGQVVVGYVRNLEPRVLTFGGEAVQPAGDLEGLAARAGAAGDDRHVQSAALLGACLKLCHFGSP